VWSLTIYPPSIGPRMTPVSFLRCTNPRARSSCHRAAPPLLRPNRGLIEHRGNTGTLLEHSPSWTFHQRSLPSTVNQEEEAPPLLALAAVSRWEKWVALLPCSVTSQSPLRSSHQSAFPPATVRFRSWCRRVLSHATATPWASSGIIYRMICDPD
jgi:hypothetical protein